jgi:sirohydrochlorin ferrochelatase
MMLRESSIFAPMSTAIILFAHGSRIESANQAVRNVAADFSRVSGNPDVEAAFLELGTPDLGGAATALASRGATRIIVVPYFLTLGLHMERDLPRLAAAAAAANPGLDIRVTPPLDGHPALLQVLLDRAEAAE